MTVRNSQTYDNLLLLKDAAALTVSGAAQVGGSNRVLDMGLADMGPVKAIVDSGAIDFSSGNETYNVAIQGSVDLAFTTPVQLGAMNVVTGAPRVEIAFSNNQAGTLYRYIRAYITVAGTTPSFPGTIYVAKD